ncbi:MAG: threonylcarbamoyl-AMP synthase [Candidatus Peribacteria bacterium]|jgi:tRNA threonylcarbamoyl adenosine modification protein (Sua5/YciO/YrdC/YwlC family)|nr:threonylcarbamoyl-AMP synthase [Candidatus Peribacteria bacterium]
MPKFKKMYSNLENPHIQKMMKCIKIQDKTTLVNRCCDYALKKMLPIYQKHYPNDDRPLQAINAAKNRLEGKIQLPEAKKSILACHESARNTENNPPAQAAARAIGQAASSIHVTAHALGIAFYGAMAVAYDTATNETQATYDKLAEVELANIEQSLRAICVGNEPHFMPNIYSPNQTTYQQAKKLLENNELVVFPTETIYGLGANALSDEAAKKIFQLKGRPNDNPLIVHLGDKKQIPDYAEIENEIQQTIIDKLMPGPITLLLKKKKQATRLISSIVCPVKYVGIRFPSNQIAQEFLQTVKLPIAAPSANLSGKPSPTNAKMVYDNL